MSISRSFAIADIPDPQNVQANFVYNFFTPDERRNATGQVSLQSLSFLGKYRGGNFAQFLEEEIKKASSDDQRKILNQALQATVPRYIDLSFSRVSIPGSSYSDEIGYSGILQKNYESVTNSEETITTSGFAVLRESDEDAILRLKQKIEALSRSFSIPFSDTEQSKKIASIIGTTQINVQSVMTPLNDPTEILVNSQRIKNSNENFFEVASRTKINSQVNKKFLDIAYEGADDVSPLSKLDISKLISKVARSYKTSASQFLLSLEDHLPNLDPFSDINPVPGDEERIISATAVGYQITRHQHDDDGTIKDTKNFIIFGPDNTRYKDGQIVYGSSYSYEVRTIVRIDAAVSARLEGDRSESSKNNKLYSLSFYVVSRPSSSVRIKTEEFEAPKEPDGVFYNFNYDFGKGLIIRWQIPTGKSRDVKYFQIFRRKSINEPFVCIGMIDFDDSDNKVILKESVREDRILESVGVQTFYEDKSFERTSSAIYAVCAVDAHGLTSGYSAQTEVGFDRTKNLLTLKLISRGGAPKQYPNFYVDPRLDDNITVDSFSQDAIFDSGRSKFTVYFSPDAKIMTTNDNSKESVYYTDSQKGKYTLHFINTDVQRSTSVDITVKAKSSK